MTKITVRARKRKPGAPGIKLILPALLLAGKYMQTKYDTE